MGKQTSGLDVKYCHGLKWTGSAVLPGRLKAWHNDHSMNRNTPESGGCRRRASITAGGSALRPSLEKHTGKRWLWAGMAVLLLAGHAHAVPDEPPAGEAVNSGMAGLMAPRTPEDFMVNEIESLQRILDSAEAALSKGILEAVQDTAPDIALQRFGKDLEMDRELLNTPEKTVLGHAIEMLQEKIEASQKNFKEKIRNSATVKAGYAELLTQNEALAVRLNELKARFDSLGERVKTAAIRAEELQMLYIEVRNFKGEEEARALMLKEADTRGGTGEAAPAQPPVKVDPLAGASKSDPFKNSLGMSFVPIPGTEVLFCIHETRSRDFAAFIADADRGYSMSGSNSDSWKNYKFQGVAVSRGAGEKAEQSAHPVSHVSWLDAVAFCQWLSKKEGNRYRLPTDREWSVAVGIPQEPPGAPKDLNSKITDVYPWRGRLSAAAVSGNYADTATSAKFGTNGVIKGYTDGFVTTAPVMAKKFPPNPLGLFDMGGNVWEWVTNCYDGMDPQGDDSDLKKHRTLRGGSWHFNDAGYLLSSTRLSEAPGLRSGLIGFRVVLMGGPNP